MAFLPCYGSFLRASIFPSKTNQGNSSVIPATPIQRSNTLHVIPTHVSCTFVYFLMFCTVCATLASLSTLPIVYPFAAQVAAIYRNGPRTHTSLLALGSMGWHCF